MNREFAVCLLLFLSVCFRSADGKERPGAQYPPVMEGAVVETYKSIGDVELKMYIFNPKDHKPSDHRPVIVFFFGGGWTNGTPKQFENQSRHLADLGMVAMCADYRVSSRHQVKAAACVSDAKSAIRWVRRESKRLGVDPNKVVAAGGSAGGHLAACTGVIDGFDESNEDAAISSRPNAMALFNPALVLAAVEGESFPEAKLDSLRERLGTEPEKISPYHRVGKNAPPTIIFHGRADMTVPYRTAEIFANAMTKNGNRCELIGYEGENHGFFNFGRGDNTNYRDTVRRLDEFLKSLGYIS